MTSRIELSAASGGSYADPFNEVDVSVEFTDPEGAVWVVPAFWAGGQEWRVRYASGVAGEHRYRWISSDTADRRLHGKAGSVNLQSSAAALEQHGRLHVGANRRHLEFSDGTPFFWLGDTWWMGLVQRKGWGWPEFQQLAADRVAKGFTLVQIVAGLYPTCRPTTRAGSTRPGILGAGLCAHQPGLLRCRRPAHRPPGERRPGAVHRGRLGLSPAVAGRRAHEAALAQPDRTLGRLSGRVVPGGRGDMSYYLFGKTAMPMRFFRSRAGPRSAATCVPSTPFTTPSLCIQRGIGRDQVDDDAVIDIDMLQTGHGDWNTTPSTVMGVTEEYQRKPEMPVIIGEVCYEGHMQISWHGVQRFMFWSAILSGAAGHTYGAGGIWQMNTRLQPHGPSPHGGTYENTPWDEAAQLPGATHLGRAKALLMRYPWWRLQPCADWAEPRWTPDNYFLPYAAGVPGEVRLVYIPARIYQWSGPLLKELEQDVAYRAFYFDPIKGEEYDLGAVAVAADGTWQAPNVPLAQDWVLVLERQPA